MSVRLGGAILTLNSIHTVAFAGGALFIGYAIRRAIPLLARYNIPAPIIGGLLVAVAILTLRRFEISLFQFDTTLRDPLNIAFFTTIGFGASLALLRIGGPQVILFFVAATIFAIVQNLAGILVALPLGTSSSLRCAGRIGDADGRSGDRLGLRSAFRTGGRAGRRYYRGCRLRWGGSSQGGWSAARSGRF